MENDHVTGLSLTRSESRNKTSNLIAGLSYKYEINANNSLTAIIKYYRTDGYNFSSFNQDNFSYTSDIKLSGDFLRSNLNFTHSFNSKLSVDLGYSNVYFSNTNSQGSNSFTRFNYRNRYSVYVNYRPAEKWNAKIGGIVEHYQQKYTGSSNNFNTFLPYVNVQYVAGKKFNVIAKYHSNAGYPTINQLNPYKIVQDSLLYTVGNPDLKTGNQQTIGLDFNLLNVITISPYYSFNKSYLTSCIEPDPDKNNFFLNKHVNADNYRNYGVNADFTVPFGKKLFWKNNVGVYRSEVAYKSWSNSLDNVRINSNLIYFDPANNNFIGLIYQKQVYKDVLVQGYNMNGNDLLLVMLRKSFFKQKLNVGLSYIFPFETGLNYDLINTVNTANYTQRSHLRMEFVKNLVFLDISYRFNAGKTIKSKQQSNDEELNTNKKGAFGL
jgi:hypothetical protein